MITGLCDEYPRLLGRHREIFVLCLLIFIYVCALPTTTYVRVVPGGVVPGRLPLGVVLLDGVVGWGGER